MNALLKQFQQLPNIPNPINKENIIRIKIELNSERSSMFRDNKKNAATIYFKTGNTTASHDIYSDSLEELLLLIKAFTDSI